MPRYFVNGSSLMDQLLFINVIQLYLGLLELFIEDAMYTVLLRFKNNLFILSQHFISFRPNVAFILAQSQVLSLKTNTVSSAYKIISPPIFILKRNVYGCVIPHRT
jgi:hypothetical protein